MFVCMAPLERVISHPKWVCFSGLQSASGLFAKFDPIFGLLNLQNVKFWPLFLTPLLILMFFQTKSELLFELYHIYKISYFLDFCAGSTNPNVCVSIVSYVSNMWNISIKLLQHVEYKCSTNPAVLCGYQQTCCLDLALNNGQSVSWLVNHLHSLLQV